MMVMKKTPFATKRRRCLVMLGGVATLLALTVALMGAPAAAQEGSQAAAPAQKSVRQDRAAKAAQPKATENTGPNFSQQLAQASREAAGESDETAQFKFSPSVRWMGSVLGLGVHGAYWLAFILNFAILALVIYLIWRSQIPAMFRSRTASIRRAMDEAGRESAKANQRLAEIETRLKRLDQEIAAMHQEAERAAASEEEKLRLAAAEDARRIVQGAEQEIAAAASLARRELRAYAAELSVALAEKRIHIDQDTDAALVRSFAEQLGNGLRNGNQGKDGR